METKNLQNQKGFTLVEIAIVLVIIGLLLGGVLKGQELIENAKVKSLTNEFDNVTAAYYAYQDRTSRFPTTLNAAGTAADDNAFWFDLKTEGFIAGTVGTSTASDGPIHSYDGSFNLAIGDGTTLVTGKAYICADGVPSDVAANIDAKVDDGAIDEGTFRAVENVAGGPIVDADADSYDPDTFEGLVGFCKEL